MKEAPAPLKGRSKSGVRLRPAARSHNADGSVATGNTTPGSKEPSEVRRERRPEMLCVERHSVLPGHLLLIAPSPQIHRLPGVLSLLDLTLQLHTHYSETHPLCWGTNCPVLTVAVTSETVAGSLAWKQVSTKTCKVPRTPAGTPASRPLGPPHCQSGNRPNAAPTGPEADRQTRDHRT